MAQATTPGADFRATWVEEPRPWWRRPVVLTLVGLALLLLVVGTWMGVRAYQAASALRSVADTVGSVRSALGSGDTSGLAGPAQQIERDAARAVAATSDPVWGIAQRLPVIGADAQAVRTVALAVDGLAVGVVTPLARVAEGLDAEALRPVDGRIDTEPLAAAAPVLGTAAEAAGRAQRAVAELDPDRLHGPLPGPVAELQEQLTSATTTLTQAERLAVLLPPMLGAEQPRNYLVLFLNSGELRAQGGIVGAVAVISVDDGRLRLVQQAANPEITSFDDPVLPLTDPERALATDLPGEHLEDVVLLPDAPRSGQLAAEMWRRITGQTVDGVLAIDPVALSYVMRATGPLAHPNGVLLDPDTLVQTLLFDAYEDQSDPRESDEFFASAAATAFDALAAGQGDPATLLAGVEQGVAERRLSVWSAHQDEQERIRGTGVDGALLTGGHDEAVGVFIDNASGWKTDTFLRSTTSLDSATCEDGRVTMRVRLNLTSTLPADSSGLPPYVVGDESTGVPIGSMRMRVSVYSPVDGTIDQIQRGDSFLGAPGATIAGRQAQVLSTMLGPGETISYVFTVTAPDRGAEIPLWTTPTTSSPGLTTATADCAGR
ncbi:DUF4012 domain-containing protein [Cellulomonas aerilata]|uniref:DUF4012 domain-containing protein n=1 Tax=Cellulomonas aerilata TaxID=515326 RepID=A0A512DDI5_9CELL|nr:DUF4012 domain-containing protein [Cellulomonas aerilata]GEO34531.1 hypothetical protein CAE01nite_22560 [Cellulomonas aerilata]